MASPLDSFINSLVKKLDTQFPRVATPATPSPDHHDHGNTPHDHAPDHVGDHGHDGVQEDGGQEHHHEPAPVHEAPKLVVNPINRPSPFIINRR